LLASDVDKGGDEVPFVALVAVDNVDGSDAVDASVMTAAAYDTEESCMEVHALLCA